MEVFLIILVGLILFIVILKYVRKYSIGRQIIVENLKLATHQIALYLSEESFKSCNPFSYENKQIENMLNDDNPCYENYLYRAFYFHAMWTHKYIVENKTELQKNALYPMAKFICDTPELLTAFYENFTILMQIYGRIIEDEKLKNIKIEKTKEQVAKDLPNIVLFYDYN